MTDKWILIKEGRLFKPGKLKTLRSWVYESRVSGRDMVSSDGGKTWTPAADTLELKPFFPAHATSIPDLPKGYSGKIKRRRRRSIEVIDMIPMLDMVFLLLIFFAVTSTFEMQRVIEMNMPEAGSGEALQRAQTLTVRIDKLNQLYLGDEPIEFNGFRARLIQAIQDGVKLTLVIKGDEEAQHGKVVRLMDIAKATGVEKIMVTVKQKGR